MSVRDLRAAKSACHACTKSYIFPTTDKSNVYVVKSFCFGLSRGGLTSGYALHHGYAGDDLVN